MELNYDSDRIYINHPQNGNPVAEIFFPEEADGIHNITHTVVDNNLRGSGIAGLLTLAVAEKLRKAGKKTRLTCSYAVKWFAEHPEYSDVVETEPMKRDE